MEKEMLMNAIADIDFLLMITGFGLFLAVAALVLVVGIWENLKETKQLLMTKHNESSDFLILRHNESADTLNELSHHINTVMLTAHNDLHSYTTELCKTVNYQAEVISKLIKRVGDIELKATKALAYVSEGADQSNDQFQAIDQRLYQLEESRN